jgi:3-oxoadipate enol-lactonase
VPRYFAPDVYERHPDWVASARAIAGATDPRGAAAMLRGIAARVASDDLFDEIDVPVSVVAGTRDAFFGVDEVRQISDGIAGASLHVLDCGHFPGWEMPDALSGVLGALLDAANAPA